MGANSGCMGGGFGERQSGTLIAHRMGKKKDKASKTKTKSGKGKRGTSELCEVLQSSIHNQGMFATQFIPRDSRIIEYVGEKISKDESDRRGWERFENAKKTGDASVYIFQLNDKWDIDGSMEENEARLINHSCDPNCEAYIEKNKIWIWSIRDIEEGEEMLFNYGFDLENWEDHPCRCGSERCVGFIAAEEYWPELHRKVVELSEMLGLNDDEDD